MRNVIKAVLGLTLLVLAHGTSWACKCASGPSCGLRQYNAADFVGRILSRQEVQPEGDLGIDRVLFKVRVIESLRSTLKVGEVVSVRTGLGGGDCGYIFKIGARYLIDASNGKGGLFTSRCSITAPVQEAEVELRNLRRLAAGKRVPDLTGVLLRNTEVNYVYTVAPLPNIPVEAKLGKGRSSWKTVTEAHGSFTFEKLPAGKYTLVLGLPNDLSISYMEGQVLGADKVPQIMIERAGADSAACHLRIHVEAGKH